MLETDLFQAPVQLRQLRSNSFVAAFLAVVPSLLAAIRATNNMLHTGTISTRGIHHLPLQPSLRLPKRPRTLLRPLATSRVAIDVARGRSSSCEEGMGSCGVISANSGHARPPMHLDPDLERSYTAPKSDLPGAARALGVVALWAVVFKHAVFGYDLSGPFSLPHLADGVLTFMALEFLSTGLFITTHDAMHLAVTPNNKLLNDTIGATAISLYAWFDYKQMHKSHWQHHNHTGTSQDPDFHRGDAAFLPWFLGFMKSYMSLPQLIRLQGISLGLIGLGAPLPNLLLFWAGSGLLSALRLFYYGTYQPHRPDAAAWEGGKAGEMPWERSRTSTAPAWLAFLQCWNFGFHLEHHLWPTAPYWELPRAKQAKEGYLAATGDAGVASSSRATEEVVRREEEAGGLVPAGVEGLARGLSRELSRGLSSCLDSCLESVSSLSSAGSMDLAYASMDV